MGRIRDSLKKEKTGMDGGQVQLCRYKTEDIQHDMSVSRKQGWVENLVQA